MKKTDYTKVINKFELGESLTHEEEIIFNKMEDLFNKYSGSDMSSVERTTILSMIQNDYAYRKKQNIKTWRTAIEAAENNLNRYDLYMLFQEIDLDSFVQSQVELRISKITGTPFIVYKGDEPNDEQQKFFEDKWFYDFITYALDYIFEGYSLIQLVLDGKSVKVQKIPLKYVIPELSIFKPDPSLYDTSGIKFNEDDEYSPYMVEVFQDRRDLGLYTKLAPLFLWSKSAKVSWSSFTEVYGEPTRIVKTASKKPEEKKKLFDMLSKFGKTKSAVLSNEDNIELLETSNTDAYNTFNEFVKLCSNEIAQLILGGSMITSDGSSYSQSQVHENQFTSKTKDDLKAMTYIINDVLMPKLIDLRLVPEGTHIKFDVTENLSIKDKFEIDSKLLEKHTMDIDYLNETYNTEVTGRIVGAMDSILGEENSEKQKDINNLTNIAKKYGMDLK